MIGSVPPPDHECERLLTLPTLHSVYDGINEQNIVGQK